MSAVPDRALSIAKPQAPSSNGIWVPLLVAPDAFVRARSLRAADECVRMVSKPLPSVHGFVDTLFSVLGIELDERMHHAIEQEALYMISTIVFVVLASLVAACVRSSQAQTDRER